MTRESPLRKTASRLFHSDSIAVLRLKDFRYLWAGNATSDLAFDLRLVVIGWLVLEMTNSQFWVGLIAGIAGIPVLLLSLIGGAVTDRGDRRLILVFGRVALSVVAFLTAYLVTAGLVKLWHLVFLTLAGGSILAMINPARRAFVADVVARHQLFFANAIAGVARNVGEIYGPAIAGYLIAARGVDTPMYLIGGFYLISAVLLLRVNETSYGKTTARESALIREILEGLGHARRKEPILGILIIWSTIIFSTAVWPLMPVYARDVLDVGPTGLGLLSASIGAGFLVGSLLAVLAGNAPHKGKLTVISAAMWNVPMAIFGFSRLFPLSVCLIFVMGVGGSIFSILTVALLQMYSDDDMRGRILSIHSFANATLPLGMILGGVLAQAVSNEFALILGAILATPLSVIVYLRSPKLRQA